MWRGVLARNKTPTRSLTRDLTGMARLPSLPSRQLTWHPVVRRPANHSSATRRSYCAEPTPNKSDKPLPSNTNPTPKSNEAASEGNATANEASAKNAQPNVNPNQAAEGKPNPTNNNNANTNNNSTNNNTNNSTNSSNTTSNNNTNPNAGATPPPTPPPSAGGIEWNARTLATVALALAIPPLLAALASDDSTEISFQSFRSALLEANRVKSLKVYSDNSVIVEIFDSADPSKTGKQYTFHIANAENLERKMVEAQEEMGRDPFNFVPITYEHGSKLSSYLPSILAFAIGLIPLFLIRKSLMSRSAGGGAASMFKSQHSIVSTANVKTKFEDVAGMDEAKQEIMEFVSFLKDPEKYKILGAKIPRGALLVGPPGTGKTMLARATAGEAGVAFFSMAGSDFNEMFVGVGASRVRDLFKQARQNEPCIIFLDEIDAVGRARSSRGNEERESTLNQLLVEMDGFGTSQNVVVLAGTNRADVLDAALLRPGRFDRQIHVSLPDLQGRYAIFMTHLKRITLQSTAEKPKEEVKVDAEEGEVKVEEKRTDESVEQKEGPQETNQQEAKQDADEQPKVEEKQEQKTDTKDDAQKLQNERDRAFYAKRMATLTPGFSGADIANVCNEAALGAARRGGDSVITADFEAAVERVVGGLERRNRVLSKRERLTVAYHEAGHAVAGWFLEHADPLLKVSIVPRGVAALGYAMYQPQETHLWTKEQILDRMCMTLGGRAAEAIMFPSITTGAQDDLSKVTKMAYAQVKVYGMSDKIGTLSFSTKSPYERNMYSEATASAIDEEVRDLVKNAYVRTEELLRTKKDLLQAVAKRLLVKENLDTKDMVELLGARPWAIKTTYDELTEQLGQFRPPVPPVPLPHEQQPEPSTIPAPPTVPGSGGPPSPESVPGSPAV